MDTHLLGLVSKNFLMRFLRNQIHAHGRDIIMNFELYLEITNPDRTNYENGVVLRLICEELRNRYNLDIYPKDVCDYWNLTFDTKAVYSVPRPEQKYRETELAVLCSNRVDSLLNKKIKIKDQLGRNFQIHNRYSQAEEDYNMFKASSTDELRKYVKQKNQMNKIDEELDEMNVEIKINDMNDDVDNSNEIETRNELENQELVDENEQIDIMPQIEKQMWNQKQELIANVIGKPKEIFKVIYPNQKWRNKVISQEKWTNIYQQIETKNKLVKITFEIGRNPTMKNDLFIKNGKDPPDKQIFTTFKLEAELIDQNINKLGLPERILWCTKKKNIFGECLWLTQNGYLEFYKQKFKLLEWRKKPWNPSLKLNFRWYGNKYWKENMYEDFDFAKA